MEGTKKKTKWDQQSLKSAIDKVLNKEMSLREASLVYNIPKSTLHGKTSALNRGEEIIMKQKSGRFTNTFTPEYEQVLLDHVQDLSNRCLPLRKKEFLKLAFDLAESMKVPHRFNKEKGKAGKHFYYDFIRRHPNISLRTSPSTSMERAVRINKPQVDLFYDSIEKLMTQYKFSSSNIYNCEKTGISCMQNLQEVLPSKTARQVGMSTSAEKVKTIALFCMSANGNFIPPFFVFSRPVMNERLMINAPADSVGVARPSGRIDSDCFLQWLQLFVKHSHPTKEKPVLLLLSGHCIHKTLAVINYCRKYNIHLISLPPHTTHKLLPLNRTFMKPFKDACKQQSNVWKRTNGSRVTDYDIASLVNKAFVKVARLDIAVSGFKCTGIFPFNRHVFSDYHAAHITIFPLEEPGTSSTDVPTIPHIEFNVPSCSRKVFEQYNNLILEESTDFSKDSSNEPRINSPKPSTSYELEVYQDVPLQDAAKKRSPDRNVRETESKCESLTSSPYEMTVEENEKQKNLRNNKKIMGDNLKKVLQEKGKQTKGLMVKGKSKMKKETVTMKEIDITTCVVCLEHHEEDWIQCSSCKGWAHEECADLPECEDLYVCDRCTFQKFQPLGVQT